MARSLPIIEALPTTEIHLMAIHCVTAEHGGLIKKKKRESSSVKLKAFPTDIGRMCEKKDIKCCNSHYRGQSTCTLHGKHGRIATIERWERSRLL